ncbi:MAG TPA: hypothetical protein VF310_08675, partial [Vicinamibacteria bacterium]
FVLSQLAYQAPMLLVCLAGVVLGVTFLPRARTPALLALAGSGLWLVVSLAMVASNAYLMRMRLEGNLSGAYSASWFGVVSVAGSLLHALALGLVVAAAFVGRPPRPPL